VSHIGRGRWTGSSWMRRGRARPRGCVGWAVLLGRRAARCRRRQDGDRLLGRRSVEAVPALVAYAVFSSSSPCHVVEGGLFSLWKKNSWKEDAIGERDAGSRHRHQSPHVATRIQHFAPGIDTNRLMVTEMNPKTTIYRRPASYPPYPPPVNRGTEDEEEKNPGRRGYYQGASARELGKAKMRSSQNGC
jgi:hypothetical protein